LCKTIKFPLKYIAENTPDKNNFKTSIAVVDISIYQNDDSNVEAGYLSTYAVTQEYKLFTF
jgi:hypothetical protein